jgi:hypothetical protein
VIVSPVLATTFFLQELHFRGLFHSPPTSSPRPLIATLRVKSQPQASHEYVRSSVQASALGLTAIIGFRVSFLGCGKACKGLRGYSNQTPGAGTLFASFCDGPRQPLSFVHAFRIQRTVGEPKGISFSAFAIGCTSRMDLLASASTAAAFSSPLSGLRNTSTSPTDGNLPHCTCGAAHWPSIHLHGPNCSNLLILNCRHLHAHIIRSLYCERGHCPDCPCA